VSQKGKKWYFVPPSGTIAFDILQAPVCTGCDFQKCEKVNEKAYLKFIRFKV
jgi:hypothetical protein